MNNTSLEIVYKNLLSSLWEELLFFIPDSEILNEVLENHKEIEFHKLRDKVLVVDYYKGPIIYEKGRNNNRVLLKGGSLKKSIRQLLNKKVNSNELEFNYYLELYFEQAECLYLITKWLNDNIKQILPQEDTIKGLFKIQSDFHKDHFETIIKQFYPDMLSLPKGDFDIGKSLASSYPNISKLYDNREKQITTPTTSSFQDNLNESPPTPPKSKAPVKKAKKQPIITELEAETILLKRIFKIG